MSKALPYLDITADVIGKVVTFDPLTGAPDGYAVIQGATPETATFYTPDGKPRLIRQWVRGANPRTPTQQARRMIHAAAVATYQAHPATCAAIAAAEAHARRITPFMAWCALYHRTHSPASVVEWDRAESPWDEFAAHWDDFLSSWDAGASIWDAGATSWDELPPSAWDGGVTKWDYVAPSVWDAGVTHWDYTPASLWDAGNTLWTS